MGTSSLNRKRLFPIMGAEFTSTNGSVFRQQPAR